MTLESETALRPVPTGSEASAVCGWCGAALRPTGDDGFRTEPCDVCGARTTWPVPTDAELELAYGSWYRPEDGRFGGFGDRALRALRGRLARRLDQIAPAGPVLDVGAGDGALLDALAAVGRDGIGIERHSDRPDVREAALSDLDGPFAAIVFWHSLEHLRESGSELERAARLLAPGGVIVGQLPNPHFPIESHSKLPMMGYLPAAAQNVYWRVSPSRRGAGFHSVTVGHLTRRARAAGRRRG